jgi:multiple sugar transport system permease protein
MRDKTRNPIKLVFRYFVLTTLALIFLIPLIWMISCSFKDVTKIFEFPPRFIPKPFRPENYIELFKVQPQFPLYYWNSIYITVLVTGCTLFVGALAGYAFAQLRFPGRNAIFLVLLSSIMIPPEVTSIPLYQWFGKLKMINTHYPLILPSILGGGGVMGLFLMRQHFLSIPEEITDAARIDGCTPFGAFVKILFPMSTSTLSALCIITFINQWNDFFKPLIYLNSSKLYTLPLALSLLSDGTATDWNLIMVAAVLATVPLLIVFFVAQDKFINSIALSGLK